MSTENSQRDQSRDRKVSGSKSEEIKQGDLKKVSGGTSPVRNGMDMGGSTIGTGGLGNTDIGGGAVSDNANQQQGRLDDLRGRLGLGLDSGDQASTM